MMAIVTSIGEPTTELCVWALQRQGFTVKLYFDNSTLADKLKRIYENINEDFVRVDADVIVNRNIKQLINVDAAAWWVQGRCFGWFSQDLIYGGAQFIRREALSALRANIGEHLNDERPETAMFRLPEFHNPRRCISTDLVVGLHGWGQDNLERVVEIKNRRGQMMNYDFEMVERMAML